MMICYLNNTFLMTVVDKEMFLQEGQIENSSSWKKAWGEIIMETT